MASLERQRKRVSASTIFHWIFLVILGILALFPILYIILASFRTDYEIFSYALPFTWKTIIPQTWTIQNYVQAFRDFEFWRPILNSVIIVVILVPINLLIASLAAYAFAFFEFKGKTLIFSLFIVSFMVPLDAIVLPLYQIMSRFGLINTRLAIILPGVASGLAIFLMTQTFRGLPISLIEAAQIDGATLLQVLRKVIIPLAIPALITCGLMIFISEWNSFIWPLLVVRSQDVRTIQIALEYFEDEHQTFWALTYAASTISILIPISFYLPLQRFFVQGITSGGVKG